MNLIQISAFADARQRSAELHSTSIRENARALSKFPDRGVYAASTFLKQRVGYFRRPET